MFKKNIQKYTFIIIQIFFIYLTINNKNLKIQKFYNYHLNINVYLLKKINLKLNETNSSCNFINILLQLFS